MAERTKEQRILSKISLSSVCDQRREVLALGQLLTSVLTWAVYPKTLRGKEGGCSPRVSGGLPLWILVLPIFGR